MVVVVFIQGDSRGLRLQHGCVRKFSIVLQRTSSEHHPPNSMRKKHFVLRVVTDVEESK
jgi:hypothetical protein